MFRLITLSRGRFLGNAARSEVGPLDFPGSFRIVKNYLKNGTDGFEAFKTQCEAMRLIGFVGLTGFLSLSLIYNLPKSQVFNDWAFWNVPGHVWNQFFAGPRDIFECHSHAHSMEDTYTQLTTKRRLTSS